MMSAARTMAAQGRPVEVATVERHVIAEPEVGDLGLEPFAVGLTGPLDHAGMGLADDLVPRSGVEVREARHGLDRPLDALARPEQAPGQDRGSPRRGVGGRGRSCAGAALVLPAGHVVVAQFRGAVVLGAMGDHHHHARVHVPAVEQPLACRLGHGHHDRRGGDDPGQHAPLVGGRGGEHRVQDGDHRDAHLGQDVEHVGAVAAAEDAVLVLDDRHVVQVERVGGPPRGAATRRSRARGRPVAAAGWGQSTTRTMPTSAPEPSRWVTRAWEKVARPHWVGG